SLTPFLRSSNRQGAKKTHVCLGFFAPLRETFSRPPIFSRSPSADMPNAPIGPPPRDGSSQTLKLPNRANLFLCFQSLTLFVRLSTRVQDAPCSHLSHRRSPIQRPESLAWYMIGDSTTSRSQMEGLT